MQTIVFSLLLIGVGLISQVRAQAGDVTIYRADPSQSISRVLSYSIIGMSAVNVDKAGVTMYAVSEVDSLYVFKNAATTTTVYSTPTTITYTIEQGASNYNGGTVHTTTVPGIAGAVSVDDQVSCKGDGNGTQANCVEVVKISADSIKTTATTSYVGRLTAIYTITGGATAAPTLSGAVRATTTLTRWPFILALGLIPFLVTLCAI